MPSNGRIVLLDGYAQIYRVFHAIPLLTNARGEPSNALFGMARFMLLLDREYPHEFGAVALDKGACKHRVELLPEYKATRAPMPDALRQQLPRIRDWMTAAGWPILEEEGREADDLIGAVVGLRAGQETYVVSHDKDLAQLVGPGVRLLQPGKRGSMAIMDPAAVEEKFGVPPEALADLLALVGDTSDNIPGVSGVGPKTAASLLKEYGSLAGVLANLDNIPKPGLRDKLRAAGDTLQRNRELVALDARPPAGWAGLPGLRRREPDWGALLDMARDNGLKSLIPGLAAARDAARSPTLFPLT